ncbi:hypothetical protein T265_05454 [Opisthorchis viverrini]|uniref:Uncharacterized protein n=1 Tax=Opisthorchis viverrini TaxID=6198 RepID=A0A074ZKB3_OPIVI|nr:hypothetical protein T265_05454 [Opisthorchis viverrini]KER27491.1 hypothetical protein T265_05454 [Opisthorchis viverrini]
MLSVAETDKQIENFIADQNMRDQTFRAETIGQRKTEKLFGGNKCTEEALRRCFYIKALIGCVSMEELAELNRSSPPGIAPSSPSSDSL